MDLAPFQRRLADVQDCANRLRAAASLDPARQTAGRAQVLEELGSALHELARSAQGLRQQANELALERDQATLERERYRSLFEFAPDGYVVTDRHGLIREANWAAGILLNTAEDALVGLRLTNFVARDDLPTFQSNMSRLEDVAGVREWEARLEPRDWPTLEASVTVTPERDVAGRVDALRWLLRDITARKQAAQQVLALNAQLEQRILERTAQLEAANRHLLAEIEERKRAEEALRASQARLAAIIDSAMDAIITVDDQQRIVLFNAAAERMFGCPAAAVLGHRLGRLIPERFQARHEAHIRAFGATGTTSRQMGALGTLSAVRADGQLGEPARAGRGACG
jgi:PAS domain S-box-containing protein